MKRETPRGPDDEKLCAWCGGPIKQSGVGRSKDYCSRTHREYAYRARREAEVKLVAYSRGRADARTVSSTDGRRTGTVPSVDETGSAGRAPVPAQAANPVPGDDFLLAPPAASPQESPVLPTEWRAAPTGGLPPGPSRSKRRRLLPPPPGAQRAEAPTLFEPEAADGE
ncbi:hypothetical protein ACFWWT_47090 [Streptomyces sp. NPDC058676]|uniref:hypothetical protein n=1 Tax=unclassified Streptomyces TaxID=2593676 RepID=UPI0036579039